MNNEIPAIKYKVFKLTADGLIKSLGENEISYSNEQFDSQQEAAQYVFERGDQYNNYLILPIASFKCKEG